MYGYSRIVDGVSCVADSSMMLGSGVVLLKLWLLFVPTTASRSRPITCCSRFIVPIISRALGLSLEPGPIFVCLFFDILSVRHGDGGKLRTQLTIAPYFFSELNLIGNLIGISC